METIEEGDIVRHKTITWINGGMPFNVIKIDEDKAECAYVGNDNSLKSYIFDVNQLLIVNKARQLATQGV